MDHRSNETDSNTFADASGIRYRQKLAVRRAKGGFKCDEYNIVYKR